jgi:hypothetical protein
MKKIKFIKNLWIFIINIYLWKTSLQCHQEIPQYSVNNNAELKNIENKLDHRNNNILSNKIQFYSENFFFIKNKIQNKTLLKELPDVYQKFYEKVYFLIYKKGTLKKLIFSSPMLLFFIVKIIIFSPLLLINDSEYVFPVLIIIFNIFMFKGFSWLYKRFFINKPHQVIRYFIYYNIINPQNNSYFSTSNASTICYLFFNLIVPIVIPTIPIAKINFIKKHNVRFSLVLIILYNVLYYIIKSKNFFFILSTYKYRDKNKKLLSFYKISDEFKIFIESLPMDPINFININGYLGKDNFFLRTKENIHKKPNHLRKEKIEKLLIKFLSKQQNFSL